MLYIVDLMRKIVKRYTPLLDNVEKIDRVDNTLLIGYTEESKKAVVIAKTISIAEPELEEGIILVIPINVNTINEYAIYYKKLSDLNVVPVMVSTINGLVYILKKY